MNSCPAKLRPASPGELPEIAAIAGQVYGELGDYDKILSSWFAHPEVRVYVDSESAPEGADQLRSLLLLGFSEPLSRDKSHLVVDLLAIAVVPERQHQGVGRQTLRHAIDLASTAARGFGQAEMRLTVSESNPIARSLFNSEGFEILDLHHGTYDRGQRAIRMTRSLPTR